VIAFLVVFGIMTFIVPKFQDIFKQIGGDLPGMTDFLIKLSDFIGKFWYVFIILPVVIYIMLKSYSKTQAGRLQFDRMKLNMPIFGVIIRKSLISRFCRTLGTLLQSGVPILDALNIVKGATGNEVLTKAVEYVHDSIREGESIAAPLAQSKVFDDMVINMIEVGEETGELDKMLLKVADTYEAEVDAAVGNLMNILEPLLIVTLGVIVGFIVVALFLPLVGILKQVQTKK
jgi:type IV pilus assembly protein PilC